MRPIPRTSVRVPVVGYSVREQANSQAVSTGSAAAHELIDIRLNEHLENSPDTRHADSRRENTIAQPQPFANNTTIIARLGISPALANRDELMTRVFNREALLATWEHHEQQLSSAGAVLLVVEGLAALYNNDLDNEVYFSACIDQCLTTLSELKSEGRIAGYGLVADHAEYCQRALTHGPWDAFVLNHRYTLLEQWPLYNLLPMCVESDTSIIVGHPFNTGVLRGKESWNFQQPPDFVTARLENIRHICRLHEVPVEAAALQFPLGHPSVASVLVNKAKRDQATIRRWLQHPINESFWDDLKLGGVMHEEAPVAVSMAARQH